ncbi:MAG TPA: hypothetical protein PLQ41_04955 [bacterium]|nr:hypothetical protein [bacterium]
MHFFNYTKVKEYRYSLTEKSPVYNRGVITFPSPFTSGYSYNDTVYVDFFEPSERDTWTPIILVHSWMERKNSATEWFARYLARDGFGAYLIHLPYHMSRSREPHKSGSLFITADVERSVNAYRQSIIDIMALCDYLEEKAETTGKKIGMTGISLGAIILNTVMGIDNRIKAGVSILGGGNIHYIFIRGLATLPIVVYEILKGLRIRDYREMTKDYIEFLKRARETKTPEEIEKLVSLREWFLIDPLTYAHLNHPRNVLMINGRFDLIIPFRATLQLWDALGRPEILWLPSTHLTAGFFFNTILRHATRYLKSHLS